MESAADQARDTAVFEVSTDSTDALRARMTVVGEISDETIGLLASAIGTHLTAGRRYLRIDITAARATDPAVLDAITDLHDRTTRLGGMLVFETSVQPTTVVPDALALHVSGLRSRG